MHTLSSEKAESDGRLLSHSRGDYCVLLATLVLFALAFVSPPLFFIERYSLIGINKPLILGLTLLLAVLLVRRFTITATMAQLGFVQLLQASLLLILPFLHLEFGYAFDAGYFSLAFQILAALALLLVFTNNGQLEVLARFWVNLHLIMGVCGALVFLGGVAFNLQPLGTFSDRPYYDFGLAYTNVYYQVGSVNLIRVAGFYDEPGTFAFNMVFALVIARVFRMEKYKESLLLLFGLTSLSMAFMAAVAIWILLSSDKKSAIIVAALLGVLTWGIGSLDADARGYLYTVTLDRFSTSGSENRLLAGDNRTMIMKENYDAFMEAPIIGHGLHYKQYIGDKLTYSFIGNPMAPLATHGVVGAILCNLHVFLLLALLATTRVLRAREKLMLGLILVATLAQRPTTINGLGYVLFFLIMHRLVARPCIERGRIIEGAPRRWRFRSASAVSAAGAPPAKVV